MLLDFSLTFFKFGCKFTYHIHLRHPKAFWTRFSCYPLKTAMQLQMASWRQLSNVAPWVSRARLCGVPAARADLWSPHFKRDPEAALRSAPRRIHDWSIFDWSSCTGQLERGRTLHIQSRIHYKHVHILTHTYTGVLISRVYTLLPCGGSTTQDWRMLNKWVRMW